MENKKLEDVCLNITDGKHGDCVPSQNSHIYFISAKDVNDGHIQYNQARMITLDSFLESHKRTKLEINDILITNSGTIGKMAFISEIPYKTTFQKSVAIIKPNPKDILPKYLFYQLLSKQREIISLAQGSTQLNLLLKDIRQISKYQSLEPALCAESRSTV